MKIKAENFWNEMSPAERLKYIIDSEIKHEVIIGHSNSKVRYDKITNEHLKYALSVTEKSSVSLDKVFSDIAKDSKAATVKTMSSLLSVTKKIHTIIREKTDVAISNDRAFSAGDIDSLDLVEIIMDCEREFSISILDEEVEKLFNFGDLINLCFDKINGKSTYKSTPVSKLRFGKSKAPKAVTVKKSIPIKVTTAASIR